MNRISWGSGVHRTDKFDPYLRQVLDKRRDGQQRHTPEAARERLLSPTDTIKLGYGGKDSGLDRVVAQFIDDLVGFYYMGAAEYEFGAIPEALSLLCSLAKKGDLVTGRLTIDDIEPSWTRGNPTYDLRATLIAKEQKAKKPGYTVRVRELKSAINAKPEPVTMYYIGPAEYSFADIERLAKAAAKGEARNKNGDRHDAIFDPVDPRDNEHIGWLCLDYPFFLVKDFEVFNQLHKLFFGVNAEQP